MSTHIYYFTGPCLWAKTDVPDQKFKRYTIDVSLDEKSQDKFKDSGLQLEARKDEKTGNEYYRFSRPVNKVLKDKLVTFGPPTVLNSEGVEFNGRINNGSTVTVKVSVYDTMKGKGHRLEAVRIDEMEGNSNEVIIDDDIDMPF